ncbi:hypothetical protein [Pedobacter sp. JCM 36344]|uniref:hypothetical protein n=1 Tax=Pedobacter sp. JCM 36344 TaxID=3374280 RepID=UPI0039790A0C
MEIQDQNHKEENTENNKNNAGYSKGESEYADGKGTRLDDAIDRENKGSKQKEQKSGSSEGEADFENPDDDPA